jgi:hypothetical protein
MGALMGTLAVAILLLLQGPSGRVVGYDMVILFPKEAADDALFTGTGTYFLCVEQFLRMSRAISTVLIKSP